MNKKIKLIFIILLWCCASVSAGYEFLFEWKTAVKPNDIVIDSERSIWVADAGPETLIKYDGTGNEVKRWPAIGEPMGIACDNDNFYVVKYSSTNNIVCKYDKSGNELVRWGTGLAGEATGYFFWPWGITVDDNYVYVADCCNNRIRLLNKTGGYASDWNITDSWPVGVALDNNYVYIAGVGGTSGVVYVCNKNDGSIVTQWNTPSKPFDIDINGDSSKIFVLCGSTEGVIVYNNSGVQLEKFGGPRGTGEGEFTLPKEGAGIYVDKVLGNIYVADKLNGRVQVFGSKTGFLDTSKGMLKVVNNVFNPNAGKSAWVMYNILTAGTVKIEIYTVSGTKVKTLVNELTSIGNNIKYWTGDNVNGEPVAPGIYFVHIEAPGFTDTQKVCVIR
ncbi:MAG: hypothetical protein A2252_02275 [Elusimicrobia bacterium RIFOXYA2_FULL_39_19]|nr:MAG: hypothetical protein A2252_02275 [Elusimicrobia bacterium RIFOXYA2_FULL_39_19]